MSRRPDDSSYATRFNAVVDYVDAHLAEPLDLQTLAAVAHFSPWHFHRLFHAVMGETMASRVRRRRLEVAAGKLLIQPPSAVLSIALDTGFASPEVFTRSFKGHFGVTPSAWRMGAHAQWADARRSELQRPRAAGRDTHQVVHEPASFAGQRSSGEPDATPEAGRMHVHIETLAPMRVAYMRHVGPYGDPRIGRLWQRFLRWAAHNGVSEGVHGFVGVCRDSPDIALPDKCRYDAGVIIGSASVARRDIGVQSVEGGLYACTRFVGSAHQIYDAWLRLFGVWLPQSGYQPDDRPAIEGYGVQVDGDAATVAFACDLCLPVRPL